MEVIKKKNNKKTKISDKLNSLEINESFDINDFIVEHWNLKNKSDIYFQRRSFDVILTAEKKKITDKKFKCIAGKIHRIE